MKNTILIPVPTPALYKPLHTYATNNHHPHQHRHLQVNVEVRSPHGGVMVETFNEEGDEIEVGQPMFVLEKSEAPEGTPAKAAAEIAPAAVQGIDIGKNTSNMQSKKPEEQNLTNSSTY